MKTEEWPYAKPCCFNSVENFNNLVNIDDVPRQKTTLTRIIKSIHQKVCRDSRKVTFKQSADKISKNFAEKVPKASNYMLLRYKATKAYLDSNRAINIILPYKTIMFVAVVKLP